MFSVPLLVLSATIAHPPPPNLEEVECAVYTFAQQFGASKFPAAPGEITASLYSALILERCQNTSATPPTPPDKHVHSNRRHLGGYRLQPPLPLPSAYYSNANQPDAAPPRMLYVATTGNDRTGDGSQATPFATLHRAQVEIRKTPSATRGAITVEVAAGTYYFNTTLAFGPEDSGSSAAAPTIWKAADGADVTLSGGLKLELEWEPYAAPYTAANSGGYGKAFQAKLPAGVPLNFTTLFVDNVRAIRARFPNGNPTDVSGQCFSKVQYPDRGEGCKGYLTPANGMLEKVPLPPAISIVAKSADHPDLPPRYGAYPDFGIMASGYASLYAPPGNKCVVPATAGACGGSSQCTVDCSTNGSVSWFAHYGRVQGTPRSFTYDPSTWTDKKWNKPERSGVVRSFDGMDWGSASYPLAGINGTTVTLGPGGWQVGDSNGVKNFYIEGIVEEVDAPFEWAVDFDTRTIYYFPNQTMPVPPPPPGSILIQAAANTSTAACTFDNQMVGCCFDLGFWSRAENAPFSVNNCHPNTKGSNQLFQHNLTTNQLIIALDRKCLTATSATGSITASTCKPGADPAQQWAFTPSSQLKNGKYGCAAAASNPMKDGSGLTMAPCDASDVLQSFKSVTPPLAAAGVADSAPPVAPPALTEAVLLDTVVSFKGAVGGADVQHIELSGFRITHAATTQLKQYEIPSGGDWAVGRFGSVTLEQATDIAVTANYFDSVGGNAVGLFNKAKRNSISGNRCSFPGDSCIVSIGSSNLVDGTADTYPSDNHIANNWMHDVGVFGKETSCYFQAVSGQNTIQNNVCYNGPRAGINFNDGFLGNNTVQGNLVFNMVRETGDHGPFNSWDRVPYVTKRNDGTYSNTPIPHTIKNNFIINGYNGVWALDHDDGSSYYNDSSNFLVYGGCKNYKGDHKHCGPDNVIIYPGIDSRASGSRSCQTNDNAGFSYQVYQGNKCVQYDGEFYTFSGNSLDPAQVPFTANNSFYSRKAVFSYNNGKAGLKDLQKVGLDLGSTVSDLPTVAEMVAWGKAAVGFE